MRFSFALVLPLFQVAYSQQVQLQVPQAAQQPTPQQAPASDPKNLGTLEGRVTNSKTGEPVRKASLTLRPMGSAGGGAGMIGAGPFVAPSSPYAVSTDAEGK